MWMDADSFRLAQVMWKNTKRVGMGALRDSKGGVYVVAHYDPVGN